MPRTVILRKAPRADAGDVPFDCDRLVATCGGGLEPLLESELTAIGHSVIRREQGAVHCEAKLGDVVNLTRRLRTASRVLVPITGGVAKSFEAVYYMINALPWERIVPLGNTFAITATTRSRTMRDHRYLAMKTRDAIVDRQRSALKGRRSSVDRDRPDFNVVVFLDERNALEVSLDAAGAPLHERGYRREAGEAPLRETVAAAMLLQAGYPAPILIDPFCGSGTIAIEAALMGAGDPPQPQTRRFAFARWPWFPRDSVTAPDVPRSEGLPSGAHIVAADRDPAMVEIARRNARRAGVENRIDFRTGDFRSILPAAVAEVEAAGGADMLVVTNPPYGERLNPVDLRGLYADLGGVLKATIPGGAAWILCSDKGLMRATGLSAARRIPMYNGGIDCRLYHLEIRPRTAD